MKEVEYNFTVTMKYSGTMELSDEDFLAIEKWLEENGYNFMFPDKIKERKWIPNPGWEHFHRIVEKGEGEWDCIEDIEFEEIEGDDEE